MTLALLEEIAIATALQSLAHWHMVRLRPGAMARGCDAYRAARARYVEHSQTLQQLEHYAAPSVVTASVA